MGLRLFVVLLLCGYSLCAKAAPTPAERAAAEALFERGVKLMEEREYTEACAAFEGTLQLEEGVGTILRLADCYEHLGRSASAWGLFREAESLASKLDDDTRRMIAHRRAEALQARLSMVRIVMAKNTVADEVRLGDLTVPRALWSSPVPVDPGLHDVHVEAPGYRDWTYELDVPEGPHLQRLEVPALKRLPPVKSRSKERANPSGNHAATPGAERRWSRVGASAAIVGAVGMLVAGYLGYRAHDANEQSLKFCDAADPHRCLARGVELRNDAKHLALSATFVSVGSTTMLLTGLGIWIWTPISTSNTTEDGVALTGAALTYSGSW